LGDRSAAVGEQQVADLPVRSVGEPLIEQGLKVGVQWDVTVGVHLPHGGAEPERGPDLHDRVDGEAEKLALAHSGAGQHLDGDAVELLGQSACRGKQLGGAGIVEELGHGTVFDGAVAGEDGVASWGVVVVPLDDSLEEDPQVAHPHPDGGLAQRSSTAVAGAVGEPVFVALDVFPTDVGDAGDVGVLGK
jgi:hypothetical protein